MDNKFELGKVVATPGALDALGKTGETPGKFLTRHVNGDWGDCCDEDKKTNEDAVKHGDRLLSAYALEDGTKMWIITESDRSATTLLLPDEY
jgi:hypothetical protein